MSDLIAFDFETLAVRVLDRQGEPWFVLADVGRVLHYRDAWNAARILDEDEKGTHTMRTPGGEQELIIINESGLYSLILRSKKPEAKRFKKWVTAEVLPTIRKTGGYGRASAPRMHPRTPIHAADVADRIRRTTDPTTRRMLHAGLDRMCQEIGTETPPLDALGHDAPTPPDIVAPFFEGLARLTAQGVQWNHSRRADQIAVNLKEVVAHFAANGVQVVMDTPLRSALKACPEPAFVGLRTVNSALTGKSVKCWVFRPAL